MTVQPRNLGKRMANTLYNIEDTECVADILRELQERCILLERRVENAEKQIVKLLVGDSGKDE
tara:strand:+ start:798 stop:986 length:189 start_codon:yes stop_codon:yes gene_type:complete